MSREPYPPVPVSPDAATKEDSPGGGRRHGEHGGGHAGDAAGGYAMGREAVEHFTRCGVGYSDLGIARALIAFVTVSGWRFRPTF